MTHYTSRLREKYFPRRSLTSAAKAGPENNAVPQR
jgi:hypothetical protein